MATLTPETVNGLTTGQQNVQPVLRMPHPDEVEAVCALFAEEVAAGRMLPRAPEQIAANLGDWIVAEAAGRLVGCVSLVQYNQELCEVRSLAVEKALRGRGLGGQLVMEGIKLARQRGLKRVLTLTRAVPFFLSLGFRQDVIANFPEKVWKDCEPCRFKDCCDEVALIYPLE